ncbi:MAG: PilZ domain-containing protein [Pseudomonadota bacterium]
MTDKSSHSIDYPRAPRKPIEGCVLIKRAGKQTLKCSKGNVSEMGLYLEIQSHDLQKGRRVEVIFVNEEGSVKELNRMSGIVLRVDSEGVALMFYHPNELRKSIEFGAESVNS